MWEGGETPFPPRFGQNPKQSNTEQLSTIKESVFEPPVLTVALLDYLHRHPPPICTGISIIP